MFMWFSLNSVAVIKLFLQKLILGREDLIYFSVYAYICCLQVLIIVCMWKSEKLVKLVLSFLIYMALLKVECELEMLSQPAAQMKLQGCETNHDVCGHEWVF